MSTTNYNQTELTVAIDDLIERAQRQVESEHKQSLYKFRGWLRNTFKIKTHYATGYQVGKLVSKQVLTHTVGNLPVGGTILSITNALYAIIEKGVTLSATKVMSKHGKTLVNHQVGHATRLERAAMDKYAMEGGVKKIRNCANKLLYAARQIKSSQKKLDCNNASDYLHNLAWYEWRLKRFEEEIDRMQKYIDVTAKQGAACRHTYSRFKREVHRSLDSLISHDIYHRNCNEQCMLNVFDNVSHSKVPTKAVPVPRSERPTKQVPMPKKTK